MWLKLGFLRRVLWTCIAAYVCLLWLLPYVWPIRIDLRSPRTVGLDKCPACYGEKLCPDFLLGDIYLKNWTQYTASRIFNAKNVFFGHYVTYHDVVLKMLARDSELVKIDEIFTDWAAGGAVGRRDSVGNSVRVITSQYSIYGEEYGEKSLFRDLVDRANLELADKKLRAEHNTIDAFGCLADQELLDFLVRKSLAHRSHSRLENVLTMIVVNPEPIVLMAFPAEEGWPFPAYHGSCGRMAVVEDAGNPLSDFLGHPSWTLRAGLARQVLRIAFDLARRHADIALYLTDWSPENFAVSATGLEVKLVDLENVVVVNRTRVGEARAPGWDVPHASVPYACERCFSYSIADLCSHVTSDHNVYGACEGVLAGRAGLLHGIPVDVEARFPSIAKLLDDCAFDTKPGGRVEAANELDRIFALLTQTDS